MKPHLEANFIVISVMGPHAGESEEVIFSRKIRDIKKLGKTFWLIRSSQAKPHIVQALYIQARKADQEAYCIFITPSSPGGSTQTKISIPAKMYSQDNVTWSELPRDLSPITGKIGAGAYALVFDNLELTSGELDLWDYASFEASSEPIKIKQGASTLCAIKKDLGAITKYKRIKSRYRRIIAVGRICEPYGVWLR